MRNFVTGLIIALLGANLLTTFTVAFGAPDWYRETLFGIQPFFQGLAIVAVVGGPLFFWVALPAWEYWKRKRQP